MRREYGGTLLLIVGSTVLMILVSVFFFSLIKVVGGERELQNANDAGVLDTAKEALENPSVALSTSTEKNNFNYARTGGVNLKTYNRAVAQTLLVALNAHEDAKTAGVTAGTGLENAKTLTVSLQGGSNSLGGSLKNRLNTSFELIDKYSKTANANSVRMLGSNAIDGSNSLSVAFLDAGSPGNVYVNENILPEPLPGNALTKKSRASGEQYLSGYRPIEVPLVGEIVAASVHPGQQPHLVSNAQFEVSRDSQAITGTSAAVPPNGVRIEGITQEQHSQKGMGATTSAVVGALNSDFPMSIPYGYIEVVNPQGFKGPDGVAMGPSIFTVELMSGIFLAQGATGVAAFSTDPVLIQQVAAYNQNPGAAAPPQIVDQNGVPQIFLQDGTPVTSLQQISTVTAISAPVTGCFAASLPNVSQCSCLLSSFHKAYPHKFTIERGDPSALISVENYKKEVWNAFLIAWPKWYALERQGYNPFQAYVTAPLPDPSLTAPHHTGLRLFPHGVALPVAANLPVSPKISRAATIGELLNQIDQNRTPGTVSNNALQLLERIKQRIREIKPEATNQEMNTLLAGKTLELGEKSYIYMNQSDRRLVFNSEPPPGMVLKKDAQGVLASAQEPDGHTTTVLSAEYQTLGLSVNPPHELAIHDVLFYVNPSPSQKAVGQDEVRWTNSSGFNNLLGRIEFRNYCRNKDGTDAVFAVPN